MEYSLLDSICFNDFLNKFSKQYPKYLNLIFLDGSGGHRANDLIIPKNVILKFIPAFSPELNPQERVWQDLKKEVKGEIFEDLDNMREYLYDKINLLYLQLIILH